MTRSALIYALTVIAIGAVILAAAAWQWQSAHWTACGLCLALALFSSTLKLKLAGLTETISPGFVFLLVSVAMLSWTETVVIAVASGLAQSLWKPQKPPTSLQLAFAAGSMAIAGGLTYGLTWGLVAMDGAGAMVVILGIAGVVLLVTNTLIVSVILCLNREGPFEMVWRSMHRRTVPYYLAGGVLANIWMQAKLMAPAAIAVLAAISVYLLNLCLRELDDKLRPGLQS